MKGIAVDADIASAATERHGQILGMVLYISCVCKSALYLADYLLCPLYNAKQQPC